MTSLLRSRIVQTRGLLVAGAFALLLPLGAVAQTPANDAPAAERQALEVLQRAEARYARLDALCADFTQVMRVALLNQVTESEGKLCQKDPDLFAMHFTSPSGDLVVADGTHLWMYFPSMDRTQVMRSRLDGSQGRFDFHREFLADPGQKYAPSHQGRESIQGRDTHVLDLVPRGASSFRSARVWVDGESFLIRRVRIEEENGSVRTVNLSNIELNPEIAADVFRFTPPAGAQVIDR